MTIMTDNAFIYSIESCEEYLQSLNFSKLDIEELKEYLCWKELEQINSLQDKAEEYELLVDGLSSNMVAAYNELEAIADCLALGKGGTKAQMADKIKKVLNYYFY